MKHMSDQQKEGFMLLGDKSQDFIMQKYNKSVLAE